jgi:hypothetical protein
VIQILWPKVVSERLEYRVGADSLRHDGERNFFAFNWSHVFNFVS